MSINNSSDLQWWTHQQEPIMDPNYHIPLIPNLHNNQVLFSSYTNSEAKNPSLDINLNCGEDENLDKMDEELKEEQVEMIHKELMFEKSLTPSDVGKLNRLVIPKQHAEKYFPLGGDSADKGFLLSFEDELGKCWRFRYSYWNSSQSYVLTKGWSRYVKEKRLDAGDFVLFQTDRFDSDRLFIGWRRRAVPPDGREVGQQRKACRGARTSELYSAHPYPAHHVHGHGPTMPCQPDCIHEEGSNVQTRQAGNSKTVRLFGVNLECQLDQAVPYTADGCPSSDHRNKHHSQQFNSPELQNNREINFCGDVKQMINRGG